MPSPWKDKRRPDGVTPVPLIVSGSRTFTDYTFLSRKLDALTYWWPDVVLLVGDAAGADALAVRWAESHWHDRLVFHADWRGRGKAAGPARNAEMVGHGARMRPRAFAVFFHRNNSPGTWVCIQRARAALPPDRIKVYNVQT